MVDVTEMRLNDVVKLIRGKAGTVVRLGVRAKGSPKRRSTASHVRRSSWRTARLAA